MNFKDDLKKAAELIKQGELVAMPTETVYGLAADAFSESACKKIYELKGRPSNNPLIVHVHNLAAAKELAYFSSDALKLSSLWPGPLTMVLPQKKPNKIAACVTAGLGTIAIRIPAHELAIQFIEQTGRPIAAPSANISGRISPSSRDHVRANFSEDELYVLESSSQICKYGLESTIIDLTTDTPTLLRYGFITPELVSEILGKRLSIHKSLKLFDPSIDSEKEINSTSYIYSNDQNLQAEIDQHEVKNGRKNEVKGEVKGEVKDGVKGEKPKSNEVKDCDSIKAPGMSYKHYAPRTRLRINATDLHDHELGLTFGQEGFNNQNDEGIEISSDRIMNLSKSGDLAEAAANLFDYLHILDDMAVRDNYKTITVSAIPNLGIGLAINDRLRRAAEG